MKRTNVIPRCRVLREQRQQQSIRKAIAAMREDLQRMQPWPLFCPPQWVIEQHVVKARRLFAKVRRFFGG